MVSPCAGAEVSTPGHIIYRATRPQRNSDYVPRKRDWRYATGVFRHEDFDGGKEDMAIWDQLDEDIMSGVFGKEARRVKRKNSESSGILTDGYEEKETTPSKKKKMQPTPKSSLKRVRFQTPDDTYEGSNDSDDSMDDTPLKLRSLRTHAPKTQAMKSPLEKAGEAKDKTVDPYQTKLKTSFTGSSNVSKKSKQPAQRPLWVAKFKNVAEDERKQEWERTGLTVCLRYEKGVAVNEIPNNQVAPKTCMSKPAAGMATPQKCTKLGNDSQSLPSLTPKPCSTDSSLEAPCLEGVAKSVESSKKRDVFEFRVHGANIGDLKVHYQLSLRHVLLFPALSMMSMATDGLKEMEKRIEEAKPREFSG
ncbi:hypothetical protein EJ04DRAFT_553728 [Polyplosphaeria fusca]|uniref:Uncharacterized protein n=1 Tax=Polyplosphaeria fusca TaxID=682080 RepID=A0A9P4QUK4_9PLEO|nr:hypothetical protein EJ04DRAFT_553728 [Polyplosphaeria fusca]